MKILFVCNSLEEGKDGIGDYTRKIAGECKARGIAVVIVAFSDRYTSGMDGGIDINGSAYHRIPAAYPLARREFELRAIMDRNLSFDWVSLQFVSYGLNHRGIVRAEIPVFSRLLKKCKTHVMVHELWVAEEHEASLKAKVLGKIQKHYILSFLRTIKPRVIQTTIPLFQKMLVQAGIKASLLPLFSNIDVRTTAPVDLKKIIPAPIVGSRKSYLIGCLFGSIYYTSWDLDSIFSKLQSYCQFTGKKLVIASIGRIGHGQEFWNNLPDKYPDIEFLTLGEQNENFISVWLTHFVDLGLVTAPALIAGKSGSCMAFLEHGIPVFCKKNDLTFNFQLTDDLIDRRMNQIDEHSDFRLLPHSKPISQLKNTVQTFINTLNNIQ